MDVLTNLLMLISLHIKQSFFIYIYTHTHAHKCIKSCIFTGRTDAEAEGPILWPPDVKS